MMYLKAMLYEAFVKYAISIKEENPTKPPHTKPSSGTLSNTMTFCIF